MKFLNDLDAKTFLLEIGAYDKVTNANKGYEPTDEEMATFVKSRSKLSSGLKDYRKASKQKANWRNNRTKMMKGIKAFHRSVDGKRFHRNLGRFLASRISRSKNESLTFFEKGDQLKALCSAKQHLFLELDYFHQIEEQIELEEIFLDHSIPLFQSIENKLLNEGDLDTDELSFLLDFTDRNNLFAALSEKLARPFEEISSMWQNMESELESENIAKDDDKFYPTLIDRLNVALGF